MPVPGTHREVPLRWWQFSAAPASVPVYFLAGRASLPAINFAGRDACAAEPARPTGTLLCFAPGKDAGTLPSSLTHIQSISLIGSRAVLFGLISSTIMALIFLFLSLSSTICPAESIEFTLTKPHINPFGLKFFGLSGLVML